MHRHILFGSEIRRTLIIYFYLRRGFSGVTFSLELISMEWSMCLWEWRGFSGVTFSLELISMEWFMGLWECM